MLRSIFVVDVRKKKTNQGDCISRANALRRLCAQWSHATATCNARTLQDVVEQHLAALRTAPTTTTTSTTPNALVDASVLVVVLQRVDAMPRDIGEPNLYSFSSFLKLEKYC